MIKKIIKPLQNICIITGILSFILGLLFSDTNVLNVSIVLIWMNNLLYCLRDVENRIAQLMFGISFFAFLLGRPIAELITYRINYHVFSEEILIHTCICLFISIFTLHCSEYIFDHAIQFRRRTKNRNTNNASYSNKIENIRKISSVIFYICYPFAMLIVIEKIIFVRSAGYIAYYTEYTSRFPYIITKIGDTAEIALFMFLATMPSKKQCKIPIVLYLVYATASLFTGKRGRFVIPIFVIIIYFIIRNRKDTSGEKWFTKKMAYIILGATPFLMAALYVYSSTRVGGISSSESFVEKITGILNETGFSVNTINYEKTLENDLPYRLYSLGDTIDYIRENILISKLFDIPVYRSYTAEKALSCYSFPHVLTYFYNAKFYLSGRGLGSCYIAEAYHDFGYLGVIVWNIVYAYVLKKMYSFEDRSIVYTSFALLSLRTILLAPRNMASAFITEWISFDNWLIVFAIIAFSNIMTKKKKLRI